MKQVLLDTNFILSSIENKIDFFEEIKFLGLEVLLPIQVIDEIKSIIGSNKKLRFRDEAELALKLIKINKPKKIDIKERYVDKGVIDYSQEHPEVIIATLDRELKKKIKNSKLVIRGKKKLEII